MKSKVSVDVMVNNGEKFYGSVIATVQASFKIRNHKAEKVIDMNSLSQEVIKRYPTLQRTPVELYINSVNFIR